MKIALSILLLTTCSLFAQTKLEINKLCDDFYVYTTYHDYKGTPVSANGLYAVTNKGVIMIDAPWDTTQCQPLLDSIEKRHHQKVVLCIATHFHDDRTGGLDYYGKQGIATYTSLLTDSLCVARGEKRANYHFKNDTTFNVGGLIFETFYPGAGHTKDNIVVWFPQQKILHGGCFIKGTEATGLGHLADADLKQWPKSIKNMKKKYTTINYVIPGHDSWGGTKLLEHTLLLLKNQHQIKTK